MADNSINSTKKETQILPGYDGLLSEVVALIEQARRTSVQTVNAIMTATYWQIGRRIVEVEQGGKERADYGENILQQFSTDLCARFGRGFSRQNLQRFRQFFVAFPVEEKCPTLSGKSGNVKCSTLSSKSIALNDVLPIPQTMSEEFNVRLLTARFPLPWSAYVCLLAVRNEPARHFYETEALRGGWSVRQLNRRLRCLVVIDLKRGKLSHADAGQMHMYLNYARENWTCPGENPPVGLILCTHKGEAMVRYALEGLSNKVLAAEYRTALPSELVIAEEMEKARKQIDKKTSGMLPS